MMRTWEGLLSLLKPGFSKTLNDKTRYDFWWWASPHPFHILSKILFNFQELRDSSDKHKYTELDEPKSISVLETSC